MVGSTYAGDRRLAIVNADAFIYQPPEGRGTACCGTTFGTGSEQRNLEQMAMLRRKFDRIADWQGCWAEDLCMRWAAREAAAAGPYQDWAHDQLLIYLSALVHQAGIGNRS